MVNIKLCDQKDAGEAWLKKRNAKAFYQPIVAPTVRQGTMALLQVCCIAAEDSLARHSPKNSIRNQLSQDTTMKEQQNTIYSAHVSGQCLWEVIRTRRPYAIEIVSCSLKFISSKKTSGSVLTCLISLQCLGVGKMRPNVVFLGFKNDWLTKPQAAIDYFNIIHDALDLKYGVGILRLQSGLDFSDFFGSGTASCRASSLVDRHLSSR